MRLVNPSTTPHWQRTDAGGAGAHLPVPAYAFCDASAAPPSLPMQALHSLVVHDQSFLSQFQVEHAPPRSVCADTLVQLNVVIGLRLIAQRASAHPHQRQRSPLAQPILHHAPHQPPARRHSDHFFATHPLSRRSRRPVVPVASSGECSPHPGP